MKYILGIDIGGTTTKIVGFTSKDMELVGAMKVHAKDPLASLYGAFGKFTAENDIKLYDIEQIMVTGVGASYMHGSRIFGINTGLVEEFNSTALGGLHLSGLSEAVVVSIGTGTAFVEASLEKAVHLGGTGVGGGTLLGLSEKMLNIHKFDCIIETAENGELGNVDLRISDISNSIEDTLDLRMTASNFGNLSDFATKADIASGIINLVCETISVMCRFASRMVGGKEVVLTGTLTAIPQIRNNFFNIGDMLGIKFNIPKNSEYATAVGAALAYHLGWSYEDL